MTEMAIPPGGEGEIKVRWKPCCSKGNITKIVTITSNDPLEPKSSLSFKAFIEVIFDFAIHNLYMGKFHKDREVSKSSIIVVDDPEKTRIIDLKSSSPFITARQLDYLENKDGYSRLKIQVTVAPGLPVGKFAETVTAYSNSDRKSEATLRLTGDVLGDDNNE